MKCFSLLFFSLSCLGATIQPGGSGGAGGSTSTNLVGGVNVGVTTSGGTNTISLTNTPAFDGRYTTNVGQLNGGIVSTGTLGVITVSSRGIRNSKAAVTNDGAMFGIDTPSTTTYGLQEALNSIPIGGPKWGTNTTGAILQLGLGDFFATNALFYSNTFPYSVHVRGVSILGTRVIYAGLGTTTNLLTFTGGGNPNGGLNLPGHVEVDTLTLTSITNMQAALLVITNSSFEYVHGVNFTDWELATNNLHGPAVSIDGPAPTQAPGNVGLVIGASLDHATMVEDCFFAGLATGIDIQGDHFCGLNLKSAFIGQFGAGLSDGTAWATTSPYSLGAFILRHGGLSTYINGIHFYQVNVGVAQDAASGSIELYNYQFETCDHAFAEFNPAGSSSTWFLNGNAIVADDIGGGNGNSWAITHGPYALATSTAVDVRYSLFTKLLTGTYINANGNAVSNVGTLQVNGISLLSSVTITNAGTAAATRNLGLTDAGVLVTNVVPVGAGGVSAGTNTSVSGTAVSLQQKLTNLVSITMNSGGGNGFTNFDGWFVVMTNSINHSFSLFNTNGDMIMSNGVVGAYVAFTNGAFFCSSNATIGGLLSVLSGTSTTVSNLINNGWATIAGGTTNAGIVMHSNHVYIDSSHRLFASNATPSRITAWNADGSITNVGMASAANPINADGSATTAAQIATLISPTNYIGVAVASSFAGTTNLSTMAPDYVKGGSTITTNASFAWLTPIGYDAAKLDWQRCFVMTSNSAASGIVMTAPANYNLIGTNGINAGGVNEVTFKVYPNVISNMYSLQCR